MSKLASPPTDGFLDEIKCYLTVKVKQFGSVQ